MNATENTDRELWREPSGDFYSSRIFVTEGGGIGIADGGRVIVMRLREWHRLGQENAELYERERKRLTESQGDPNV